MLEFSAPVDQHVDITGLEDQSLFKQLLSSGERSAIFELRSSSSAKYPAELSLHFFYLNVGFVGKPWITRVEIPAWVASRIESVNLIHQALLAQCRLMGTPPYPYLLHRAYEEAVVRFGEEKENLQPPGAGIVAARIGPARYNSHHFGSAGAVLWTLRLV